MDIAEQYNAEKGNSSTVWIAYTDVLLGSEGWLVFWFLTEETLLSRRAPIKEALPNPTPAAASPNPYTSNMPTD